MCTFVGKVLLYGNKTIAAGGAAFEAPNTVRGGEDLLEAEQISSMSGDNPPFRISWVSGRSLSSRRRRTSKLDKVHEHSRNGQAAGIETKVSSAGDFLNEKI
jgi:hypothetical protein